MVRLSFSQFKLFENCPYRYKLQYVDKVPDHGDKKYADRGSVLHNTLEYAYKLKILNGNTKDYFKQFGIQQQIKDRFENEWNKYKLGNKLNKDESWLMVLNGVQLDKSFSSMELKIFYPNEFVCYIDGVNSFNDELIDWKSSTRSRINEREYTEQLLTYGLYYYKKFGRYPKKSIVYYLKPNNTLECHFNLQDYKNQEEKIKSLNDDIEKRKANKGPWPKTPGHCFFCPYKEICKNDDNLLNYNLVLYGNYFYVHGEISPLLQKGFDQTFSYELPSAHFIKKATAGQWDGVVHLYNTNKNFTMIGFKEKVIKTLNDYAKHMKKTIKISIDDRRRQVQKFNNMPEKFIIDKQLRNYQEDAVEIFLKEKFGVIEGGCGFGKTLTSAEIIRQLDCRTLFIIDRKELVTQTKEEYEELLGIECGIIGMGKDETDKQITIATYQTLAKDIKKYQEFLKTIDFAIMDEVHIAACKSIQKIGTYLSQTNYRLGLSGTPFRDDGETMKMFGICGPIIYVKQTKELIDEEWLTPVKCQFIQMPPMSSGKYTYQESYKNQIVHNSYRNNLAKQIIEENKDKKILVLTKLVEHGQDFAEKISTGKFVCGSTNDVERKQVFNDFKNGIDINVLIGSASIFSKGINVPDIDIIINLSGNKGDVQTLQTVGRELRKSDGKEIAYYYDFLDSGGWHKTASNARIKILKEFGYDVEVIKK